MNAIVDPALAARNRQAAEEARRKSRNAERRSVVDMLARQASPVEFVRIDRDLEEADWRDPDDVAVNRRTPKVVRGYRRVSHLVRLQREKVITQEHAACGIRLLDDYEVAEGARLTAERSEVRGSANVEPSLIQLSALGRYQAAVQAVGKSGTAILLHVCLHNASLTAWSERHGVAVGVATGRFLAAMDRLVEHYQPGLDDLRRVEA